MTALFFLTQRHRERRYFSLSLTFAFIIVFASTSLLLSQEQNATKPIGDDYFCMHVHTRPGYEKVFTDVPFKIMRTWDSGIVWPHIEPENDVWNWDMLDRFVELARENNKQILFTLGMTPPWAASNPNAPSAYGDSSSSPPANIEDWKDFIRTVAEMNEEKYGGTIRYWEIWNEPDNFQKGYAFYTGTIEDLAAMTRAAYEVLKSVNPENQIVGPGVTQVAHVWLDNYLKAGARDYIDIVGFHFYWDWYTSGISDFKSAADNMRKVMNQNGLEEKPLWLTETGFGLNFNKTTEERLGALATMILAPRYFGVDMTCAYSWNNSLFTGMYDDAAQAETPVAGAYREMHRWLLGATIVDMNSGSKKTKVATLEKNGVTARIVWRQAKGNVTYDVDASWGGTFTRINGATESIPQNRIIELDGPVLISNDKYFQ